MLQRFTLFFTALFLTFNVLAQTTIKLSGRVLNEKNEPVSGATVLIEGTGKGNPADIEGRFSLNLEPGKKYTITISAVSYDTKKISDVEVGTNLDNTLEVVLLLSKKNELGGVTVTASSRRQENTNALLSFQKNNTALSSGLAADFIRRTPDKNTGEILKRVSGASIQDNKFVIVRGLSDRYNAATINNAQMTSTEPDKKAFSFDVIPAALVDNIVINKTATPEFTGEFAGGLVQINTKDVPTKNFLNVGFSIGLNTQSAFKDFVSNERNKTDWLGYDDGTRSVPSAFPKNPQAYRILGSNPTGEQEQYRLSRLFNTDVYRQQQSTAGPIQSYNIAWGNAARLKNGGSFGTVVSLQYRKSKLLYNVERRLSEENGNLNIQLFDAQNKYTVNTGAIANLTYVKGKHKVSFKNLYNQLFDDNFYHRTGVSVDRGQDINFYSSVLNQRSLYSGQLEGEHQLTQSGIKLKWNGNLSYNWKSQPDLRTQAYFRSTGSGSDFEINDDDTRRFFSDLKDYSYGANGSLTFPFTLAKDKQTFKVGGSTLIRIRDFKSRIFRYDVSDISQFDHSKASLPYDQIFLPGNIGDNGFIINDFTNNQDKYFGVSALNGMFGMFDNKFGEHTRLVWGVRVENFQQVLTTKDVTAKRVVVETEKWDVLPSMNFTYTVDRKNSIRVSASRTVSRPEFREIAPFSFFDYESNYAVNGNTELKRGSIINGDLRYEFYPKAGEGITIGAFYKSFDDPIEFRLNPSSVLDRRNYEYGNADKAYTIGGELEIRKNLEFISAAMKAFSVFTNFTYISSKVTLPSISGSGTAVSQNRPLQGQSPYLINFGLQYNSENGIYSGSLLYNRVGQRLSLVGLNDLGFPDVYENPRNQMDFQLSTKIMKRKGELKLTWADIFNNDFLFYENVNSKKSYQSGTDRIFSKYTPGSTITLGFTYDFSIDGKNKK
jgi:TonB-dependent receptor